MPACLSASSRAPLAASFAAALVGAGCKSPAEYRLEADHEVFGILERWREELAADGPFDLEPRELGLREELLAGAELEPLSLPELLEVAAATSRGFQDRREALYLEALELTLERWRFSAQESGTLTGFLDGQGREGESAGLLSNLGLLRLLASGMQIAASAGLDFVREVSTGDGWDAVSSLSLTISQPLLRGFGEDVVREPLTQAERDVLYEARSFERFRRTFAFDVAERFFRVLQQRDRLENEERNFENLQRLRERNEAFAEAGLLTDIQVDQARQDELRARSRVIESRQRLQSLLDGFKLFLGLPITVDLDLDPGQELSLARWEPLDVDPPEEAVVEVALERRLDYLNVLGRMEDARRQVRVAADALRPGLDVVASGTAASLEGRPLDYRGTDFDWDLSLALDLPLERLPERNAFVASQLALDAAVRGVEEAADEIVGSLRDSIRRLVAAREDFRIQSGAVELAERRVESAELNLEAGRASTRDVLEAQEDLVQAQNAVTDALTEYVLALLALYRDMELLRVGEQGLAVELEPLLLAVRAEEARP